MRFSGFPYDTPPQIALAGQASAIGPTALGSTGLAADAGHVHAFGAALQRTRVAASASTTWTFDTPFVDATGAPVLPVIAALVECPTPGMAFAEPQITNLSSTSVTLGLKVQATSLNVASLGSVSLFQGAIPAGTFLHITARNPSA